MVDLNANGTLVFQGSTPISAQFKTLRAELYADWGSVCDPAAGGACNPVSSHPEIMDCTVIDIGEDACDPAPFFVDLAPTARRWVLNTPLVAGRYVLRVISQKGTTATGSYTGRVALRK